MHQLNAGNDGLGSPKRFESQHRPGDAFDGAVILLHDVVEVLDLPNCGGYAAFLV